MQAEDAIEEDRCFVVKAPSRIKIKQPSVFLCGSVQTKEQVDWRARLTSMLSKLRITIINPHRNDWDSSWKQDITNLKLKEQIAWELDYMEEADIIAIYLEPGVASPVSLLELGLYARDKKQIVCCPEGFSRRGNVQFICERYKNPLVDTIEELGDLIAKEASKSCY